MLNASPQAIRIAIDSMHASFGLVASSMSEAMPSPHYGANPIASFVT